MRIAYCIHAIYNCGGTENVLIRKADYLASEKGWEVFIITAHQHGRDSAFPVNSSVKVIDLDRNDATPFWRLGYLPALERCLNEIKPAITVAVNGKAVYALPSCNDGSKKVSEFHFSYEKYMVEYGKGFLGRKYAEYRTRLLGKAASKMDSFVVLTKKDRECWSELVPNVIQIYNPVTVPGTGSAGLDNRIMVAVGRLSYQKNYQDMLEVWSKVSEKHPDWTLKIYGDGPEKAALETIVTRKFKNGNVKLMGRTDNVPAALMESSGLLLTSRFEGLPLILIEASSYGVPLISYDCPKGPAEIIEDGKNGFLIKQGDIENMAQRICLLIEDEELRKETGAQAKFISDKFSIKSIMNQWEVLFNDIILK